jgi:hypothetical protein
MTTIVVTSTTARCGKKDHHGADIEMNQGLGAATEVGP